MNPSLPAGAPTPFPILFITSGRVGDAVLSTGLLDKLIREVPGARFTIAAGPLALPLFEDVPGLDALIPMEKQKRAGHWIDLWRQVRRTRWGLVVDLRGSLTAHFLRRKRRAVYAPRLGVIEPKVVDLARVLQLETAPPMPRIPISQARREQATRLIPADRPVLALGAGASWLGKIWPTDRFGRLAMELTAGDGPFPDARILLVGGPGDHDVGYELSEALPTAQVINLIGKLDLLTTAACLERSDFYVGNDSGLMHMAAAMGVPTLGLFGPSDDRVYAPWGPNCVAVRGNRSLDALRLIDSTFTQEIQHMNDLSLDKVRAAAFSLIARAYPVELSA